MRHLPNIITLGRILLIWPVVVSMRDGQYLLTLGWFVVAAVSDIVDSVVGEFEVDAKQCEKDVLRILSDLIDAHLIAVESS